VKNGTDMLEEWEGIRDHFKARRAALPHRGKGFFPHGGPTFTCCYLFALVSVTVMSEVWVRRKMRGSLNRPGGTFIGKIYSPAKVEQLSAHG
jgi:hypothetical protein